MIKGRNSAICLEWKRKYLQIELGFFFFFFNFVFLSYSDFDMEVFVVCAAYDKGPSYAVCNACSLDDLCRIVQ